MTGDKKILIVEDEAVINKVYAEGLKDEGFIILVAMNGKDGLDIALREKPDLILLDILMPVMDGLTMMDQLRGYDIYGKNVPIIILTNLSAREEKILQAIEKNNPAYYFVKSNFNLSKILEKIKECLSQKV